MKKTANEPGDPRIEENGTWNSHRDANSGSRPVPSMSLTPNVRGVAGVLPAMVGVREDGRFRRWGSGFFLVVCRLTWQAMNACIETRRDVLTWSSRVLGALHRWLLRRGSLRGLLGAIRFRILVFRGWIWILYGLPTWLDFAPSFS